MLMMGCHPEQSVSFVILSGVARFFLRTPFVRRATESKDRGVM
jgi:hypothetical protein